MRYMRLKGWHIQAYVEDGVIYIRNVGNDDIISAEAWEADNFNPTPPREVTDWIKREINSLRDQLNQQ